MSERYTRLFTVPENLYAATSPVIIAAGALLKDNRTGKVLAQLKMRNIGAKVIKAVRVSVRSFDTVGNSLGDEAEQQYLDLAAAQGQDFGAKTPILLADAATRSFSATVKEVVFADNTIWTAADEPWEPLPTPVTLEESLNDAELVKQYHICYGEGHRYALLTHKDLWCCACGEWNRKEEGVCRRCGETLSALESVDLTELRAERDARLAAEAEAAAAKKAAAAARMKKVKVMALVIAALLIVAGLVVAFMAFQTANRIQQAREEAESGDYMAAVAILDELDKPEKTADDRQEYLNAMETEIQSAISAQKYADALELIDQYSVLKTAQKNIQRVQARCPHQLEDSGSAEATCTEDGYEQKTCSVCGYVDETTYPAFGHSFVSEVTLKPTCTKTGTSKNTCTVCGAEELDKTIAALGHDYVKTIPVAAGCTTNGQARYTCSRCNDSYTEVVKATGHKFSKATCTMASVCSNCGITNTSALGHTTTTGVCSRCGYNFTPAITISGTTDGIFSVQRHGGINLAKGKYIITIKTNATNWSVGITHEGHIAFGSGNATTTFESRFNISNGSLAFKAFESGMAYTITIKPVN